MDTPPSGMRHRLMVLWLPLLLAAVAGGTAAGWLRRVFFGFDILANFPMQLFLAALAGLVVSVLVRRRWLAAGFALVVLANGVRLAPLYLGSPPRAEEGAVPFRLAAINVNTANTDYSRVVDLLRARLPDVAVLMEMNGAWVQALRTLRAEYPYWIAAPREDNFGLVVISRLPFLRMEMPDLPPDDLPTAIVRVEREGATLTVIGTHPLPPISGYAAASRDEELARVAQLAREARGPVVVLGDFNATPWSRAVASLRAAGLRDSLPGFGYQASWPAGQPWYWIPIDQVYTGPGVGVVSRSVGPAFGSDHYPVWAEVAVPKM